MKIISGLLTLFFLILAPSFAKAGGPYYISTSSTPSTWQTLTVHPESGSCAGYTQEEMLTLIDDALNTWLSLSDVNFEVTVEDGVVPDITVDNYLDYLVTGTHSDSDNENAVDGLNPIAFDDDGLITDALIGEDSKFSFVGLTSLNTFNEATLLTFGDGQMIFNCFCLENHPNAEDCKIAGIDATFSEEVFQSMVVHETGHLFNLDHSAANDDLFNSSDAEELALMPTMYPFVFEDPEPFELTTDDVVAMARLYPSATFEDRYCLVTGTLTTADGDDLRCANIVAESSDLSQTVSFVTGALSPQYALDGSDQIVFLETCTTNCGTFELYLESDTDYTLRITELDSAFVDGSSVGPCFTEQDTSIVAEDALASITQESCTGGAEISLGTLITQTSSDGTGGDSTDTGSDSNLPGSCSLNTQSAVFAFNFYKTLFSFMIFLFVLRFKTSFVKVYSL